MFSVQKMWEREVCYQTRTITSRQDSGSGREPTVCVWTTCWGDNMSTKTQTVREQQSRQSVRVPGAVLLFSFTKLDLFKQKTPSGAFEERTGAVQTHISSSSQGLAGLRVCWGANYFRITLWPSCYTSVAAWPANSTGSICTLQNASIVSRSPPATQLESWWEVLTMITESRPTTVIHMWYKLNHQRMEEGLDLSLFGESVSFWKLKGC